MELQGSRDTQVTTTLRSGRKLRAWLTQQAVWDIEASGKQSMPLATAYLKAMADGDPALRSAVENRIYNFGGADTPLSIAQAMLANEVPDILSASILGWNYNLFGRVADIYRQLNPNGWIVFGGTHVANRAARVFGHYPSVNIIVDGEGERVYCELLRARLAGQRVDELHNVKGISFRAADGTIVTTPPAPLIQNLDEIPSPFLSGAMPLTKANGEFLYDVVLMETSRGCPYKCAFCYWGGAVGQKIRCFSTERLAAEIDLFGRLGVTNICLCDSNFGMTKADEAFADILVRTREKYGFPREVVTSWAKNKGQSFYRIVERFSEIGFQSSFTLALQTLSDKALGQMHRKNMRVNDWEDLAKWLKLKQLDVYGELLWGCPGETVESFLDGYDRLAAHVSRIGTYPLLIIPNTEYSDNRDEFGFVTYKTGKDDFEYVLSHNTMTLDENKRMHRLLFWLRAMGEYPFFRFIHTPLRVLAGITHTQMFRSLDRWLDDRTEPVAALLRASRAIVVDRLDAYAIENGLTLLHGNPDIPALFRVWFEDEMLPRAPEAYRGFLREVLDYDLFSKPRLPQSGEEEQDVVELFDARFYAGEEQTFLYQVPSEIRRMEEEGEQWRPSLPRRHGVKLFYKVGFADYIANHEFFMQYYGKTRDELEAEQTPRRSPAGAPAAQRFELTPAALQASRHGAQAGLVADPRPGQ
jgi:radical SAM superfamily enzyme YgiQ (UPF0313 family)